MSALTAEIEARCLYLGEIETGGEEDVRYLSDQFVNGRQRYRCAHCYRWIEKGERQRSIRAVVDGEFIGSCRYCAECCVAQYEDDRPGGLDALVARIEGAKTIDAWLALVAAQQEERTNG